MRRRESTGTASIDFALDTDLVVMLTSSNVDEATVPEFVTITKGQLSADFTITGVDANYHQKRDHLTCATPGGLNGSFLLDSITLIDDADKDTLKGDSGRDLFFAKLNGSGKDKVKDKKPGEDLFSLF